MLKVTTTKKFKKDIKKAELQGKKLPLLKQVMTELANKKKLPPKYKDHKLTGNFTSHRECHIEPDSLLIYKLNKDTITFERTGSHSELFK